MAGPVVPRRGSTDTGFTSSSACGYGNPRNSTAFTVLKMAVFAPIPSARTASETAANPRLLFSVRKAKRTSWVNAMSDPACQSGEHARGDSLPGLRTRVAVPDHHPHDAEPSTRHKPPGASGFESHLPHERAPPRIAIQRAQAGTGPELAEARIALCVRPL